MGICTIRLVAGIERVTRQLVSLLAVLLEAYLQDEVLHGYALMKLAGLSGASTYRNLDRLEDAHLVDGFWEKLPDSEDRPRRRYYRLNPEGAAAARVILEERRPAELARLGKRLPGPRPERGPVITFARPARGAGGAR
jgi:PadR family transcriptional regulator, regulatory protein PadR